MKIKSTSVYQTEKEGKNTETWGKIINFWCLSKMESEYLWNSHNSTDFSISNPSLSVYKTSRPSRGKPLPFRNISGKVVRNDRKSMSINRKNLSF